ncbi:MAG: OsmC family peroxiredoxin [Anaerolineales bacterium]|nr:MAG: OsmC family peroxiredoxin [Anaerolineales bacterium]
MNNVNVQEIERFVSTIQEDPAQAKKTKGVTGSWVFEQGKPQFVSTVEYAKGKVVLNAELPPFAGGWGTSPDPIQYCLYGLAACFAATFVATAASKGVQLTGLEVTAENWMDLRKQMGLTDENIIEKVKFTVQAEGASRDELEKILALTEERCPGVECVTRTIPLEVELRT